MRWRAYPAYKDSGIEWLEDIPKNWTTQKCKYVFREVKERSEDGTECLLSVSEYYGVAARADVIEEGDYLTRANSLIGYKRCARDDLVINIMLAWKRGLGISPSNGIVSPSYSVFRCLQRNCAPKYLHYLLRTDLYITQFKSRSTGIIDSRLRMYPEDFGQVVILLPHLDEQHAIAAFLDRKTTHIDTLIAKKECQIELLQEKRAALISHAVTKGLDPGVPMKDSGVEWLGKIPAHWEMKRLKFIADVQSGVAKGRNLEGRETIDLPYLRVANVQRGYVDLSDVATITIGKDEANRYSLQKGDILMTEGGDYDKLGRGAVWEGQVSPCVHQNHIFAVRAHQGRNPYWISTITQTDYARHYFILHSKQSTNLASISSTNIMELSVVLPPFEQQGFILSFLDRETTQIDSLVAKVQESIERLQEYRTALISAAVTGKIDVRDEQAQHI